MFFVSCQDQAHNAWRYSAAISLRQFTYNYLCNICTDPLRLHPTRKSSFLQHCNCIGWVHLADSSCNSLHRAVSANRNLSLHRSTSPHGIFRCIKQKLLAWRNKLYRMFWIAVWHFNFCDEYLPKVIGIIKERKHPARITCKRWRWI